MICLPIPHYWTFTLFSVYHSFKESYENILVNKSLQISMMTFIGYICVSRIAGLNEPYDSDSNSIPVCEFPAPPPNPPIPIRQFSDTSCVYCISTQCWHVYLETASYPHKLGLRPTRLPPTLGANHTSRLFPVLLADWLYTRGPPLLVLIPCNGSQVSEKHCTY